MRRWVLLPEQAARVCYYQLDALAVAELPNAQLLLQTGGGQHNHLHREGEGKQTKTNKQNTAIRLIFSESKAKTGNLREGRKYYGHYALFYAKANKQTFSRLALLYKRFDFLL